MVTKNVVFSCGSSMPTKVIALLIQKASHFKSSVWISKDDRKANAKSLIGVMSLAIEDGMEVTVFAEGPDAEEAVDTLVSFLADPQV